MLLQAQALVREFHRKFGVPLGAYPAVRDRELRQALIMEEARETRDAMVAGDLPGAVDGLCDLIYVSLGAAETFGVELAPHFMAVHAANMRKQGGATRADGKILKPEGWVPPNIAAVLESQGWRR